MQRAVGFSSVPFSPPAWFTPVRIAWIMGLLISSVGALCVGMPLAMVVAEDTGTASFVLFSTLLLSSLLIARVLRAKTPGGAVATCLLAVPAGMINAALLVLFVKVAGGTRLGGIVELMGLCASFGGGAGVPFAVAFSLPLGYAVRLRNRPSHAGADRMLIAVALWSYPLVLASVAALVSADHPGVASAVTLVALAPLVIGMARLARRAAWLRRVRTGAEAGWEIAVARPEDFSAGLSATSGRALMCSAVLRRSVDDPRGPYRSTSPNIALALVPDEDASWTAAPLRLR